MEKDKVNKSPDKNENNNNNNDQEPLLKKQQRLKQQETNYNEYNINNKRSTNSTTTISTTTSTENNINNNKNEQDNEQDNDKFKTTIDIQHPEYSKNSLLTNNNCNNNSNNNSNNSNNNNSNKKNKKNSHMVNSYENNIIYKTEGPFNETIPIMKSMEGGKAPIKLPLTFLRGLWVIILVVVFLLLAASYFIEYRFLDTTVTVKDGSGSKSGDSSEQNISEQNNKALHYLFIATRPIVLLPLVFIIPLYGINDKKTYKYSIFISIALILNIIGDCIYSFQINNQITTDPKNQSIMLNEMMYLFSLIFYMCSRLMYTIAFIIGIGKSIKPRLFHSIPFYIYSGTLILLVVFSKSIAPYMAKNNFQPLPSDVIVVNGNGTTATPIPNSSSGSSDLTDVDPVHFSLICVYGFIESTMVWRALSLTSSFPGTNPSKILLWLSVLGATTFGCVDTLLVINTYYSPIKGIFYLSTGGIWIAHALIVFSIPRRNDVRDYIFKVFRLNKRGIKIISNSKAFQRPQALSRENSINRKSSINI